jgi:hypothetical protein
MLLRIPALILAAGLVAALVAPSVASADEPRHVYDRDQRQDFPSLKFQASSLHLPSGAWARQRISGGTRRTAGV